MVYVEYRFDARKPELPTALLRNVQTNKAGWPRSEWEKVRVRDVSCNWVARVRGRLMWLRIMLNSEQRQGTVLVMLKLGYVRARAVRHFVWYQSGIGLSFLRRPLSRYIRNRQHAYTNSVQNIVTAFVVTFHCISFRAAYWRHKAAEKSKLILSALVWRLAPASVGDMRRFVFKHSRSLWKLRQASCVDGALYVLAGRLLLSDFNENRIFSTDFRQNLNFQISWKSVQW